MQTPRTNFRRASWPAQVGAALAAAALAGDWLGAAPPTTRRAKRPEFPPSTVEAFFPDATAKLQGERPGPRTAATETAPAQPVSPAAQPTAGSWSKIISAETLEDEIKARATKLATSVENLTRFKGGEYQTARRELAVLAAMLGVVAEYDGRVRWKSEAAALRDQLGRASNNCKVASDAALADARARAEDLQSLVRGELQPSLAAAAGAADWPQVADRALLMQRLEEAQQSTITPAIASEASFREGADTLLHDAEVVATLAEIITRGGYEFADDETYLEYARQMQEQARALQAATREGTYEQARSSALEVGRSCTTCHEGYRS